MVVSTLLMPTYFTMSGTDLVLTHLALCDTFYVSMDKRF